MNQPALKKRHCTRSQIRGYRYLSRIDDCGRILRNALRDRTAVQWWYHYGTYSSNVNTLSWATSSNQLSSEFTASDNGKWARTCVCLTISTGYTHDFLTKGWILRIRHALWYSRCSAVAFKWFGIYVQTTQELPLYRLVFAYNARI